MAERINELDHIISVELNISSCPNVKLGGMAFGTVPSTATESHQGPWPNVYKKVLMVENFRPMFTNITDMAKAVAVGGADVSPP